MTKLNFCRAVGLFALTFTVLCGFRTVGSKEPAELGSRVDSQVAARIYDDLVRATGDGRTPPRLALSHDVLVAAFCPGRLIANLELCPGENLILLDERLLELAPKFGSQAENALAYILAHELAHYYRDHGWTNEFGNSFADRDIGQKMKQLSSPSERFREEAEADYMASFYAYQAGYQTEAVATLLLEEVYRTFKIDENLNGYPSLADRKVIAERSVDRFRRMASLFQVGYHFLLIEKYEAAARAFDYIADEFPSREILNNAGLARVKKAMSLFTEHESPLAYPWELDTRTRLDPGQRLKELSRSLERSKTELRESGSGNLESESARLRRLLLDEARKAFERAIEVDERYVPAYINLAGTLDLLGKSNTAIDVSEDALRLADALHNEQYRANLRLIRGLAYLHTDRREQAVKEFQEAREGTPRLATQNLTKLGVLTPSSGPPGQEVALGLPQRRDLEPELTPDLDLHSLAGVSEQREVFVPPVDWSRPGIEVWHLVSPEAEVLRVRVITSDLDENPVEYIFFLLGSDHRGSTRRGVRLGHSMNEVIAQYGTPSSEMEARDGRLVAYAEANIIFFIKGETVRGWTIYDVS